VVEAFEASGLGAVLAPPAIGGTGEGMREVLEAIEKVSIADTSARWCCAIGLGSNYLAALVAEATARELFSDLRKGGAGPFTPAASAMPNGRGGRADRAGCPWPDSGPHDGVQVETLTEQEVIARPVRQERPIATGRRRPRTRRPVSDIVSEQRG